jgi:hypothetical protein
MDVDTEIDAYILTHGWVLLAASVLHHACGSAGDAPQLHRNPRPVWERPAESMRSGRSFQVLRCRVRISESVPSQLKKLGAEIRMRG